MAEVNLSLDDIIRKKNIKFRGGRGGFRSDRGRRSRGGQGGIRSRLGSYNSQPSGITDARLKIIEKKRTNIRDARDKLSEMAKHGDARDKISRLRLLKMGGSTAQLPVVGKDIPSLLDTMEWDSDEDEPLPAIFQRTIVNPSKSLFTRSSMNNNTMRSDSIRNPFSWKVEDRGDDADEIASKVFTVRNPMVSARVPPLVRERVTGSRMILEKPIQPARVNITRPTPNYNGCKVIVSNLQSCVSQEDITELFADIGPLVTAELVQQGMAEVTFQSREDAKSAVSAYHKRKLDGCPMFCILQDLQPPQPNVPSCLRSSGGSSMHLPPVGHSYVTPDLATIHKALFQRNTAK